MGGKAGGEGATEAAQGGLVAAAEVVMVVARVGSAAAPAEVVTVAARVGTAAATGEVVMVVARVGLAAATAMGVPSGRVPSAQSRS